MHSDLSAALAIPDHVTPIEGPGRLPGYRLRGRGGEAIVLLHGAHITSFTPEGAAPVLWMSAHSHYRDGKPIRGGIPVCWPWFGPHAADSSLPAHGVARLRAWEPVDSAVTHDGRVRLRLGFIPGERERGFVPSGLHAEMTVTVGASLEVELTTYNDGSQPALFHDALHTYFAVSDIDRVAVRGLEGCVYFDKMDGMRARVQEGDIRFCAETDRVYRDRAPHTLLVDEAMNRRIRVEKSGSASTVIWNPHIAKARAMPDFGDAEWRSMCCVETANVLEDGVTLLPRTSHCTRLRLTVDS